ncbi:hypothetical protein RND71_026125 [Anisodus tanguticus]|uniref:AP2/ERF domain-containing protein n=1 Tax=Anisodus tanguticus TaxID=243964 RepID=A0AAE1RMX8_9SOLA|nr:hypothetical protein RND71_026125 [Anisodus tanguticus]
MTPENNNNWLSFSLSSMEMLNSSSSAHQSSLLQSNGSSSADSHQYYFADNFFPHGWTNPKAHQVMYSEVDKQVYHPQGGGLFVDSPQIIHQNHQPQPPPKLEDFFGGETETQDSSSLTHIYDHHNHHHHGGGRSAVAGGYFTDGRQDLNTVGCRTTAGALSLAVNNINSTVKKAIVNSVDSESCKKITDHLGQRTSIYRGIDGQEDMKRIYGITAVKERAKQEKGVKASNYAKEIEEMKHMTKQEFIASLRRKSSGFSRGASMYRGVTRHHQQGRWQARIGRVAGNKDLYLGTFATEEEAAEAYDIAAIKFRGVNAVTNFEMNRYDVEAIMKSSLPIGGAAKRLKISLESEQKQSLNDNYQQTPHNSINSSTNSINFGAISPVSAIPYGLPLDPNQQPFYHHSFFPHLQYSSNDTGASDHTSGAMPLLTSPGEIFIWPHQYY